MGKIRSTRRGLALLLAFVLVTLAGCGNAPAAQLPDEEADGELAEERSDTEELDPPDEAEDPDEPDDDPAEEDPPEDEGTDANGPFSLDHSVDGLLIGVCIYSFEDSFMLAYRDELERLLVGGGANLVTMDGKSDQAEQIAQVQSLVAMGADVLIVNPVVPQTAPMIADLCDDAGIPVVFINRAPPDEEMLRWADEGLRTTYVGVDAAQAGRLQGELLLALPDRGDADGDGVVRYVMITGELGSTEARLRTEYAVGALVDAGVEVDCLHEQSGDWSQVLGREVAENALAAFGSKIDVIICNNDLMALGALNAIEAAGLEVGEDIYLVGIDALTEALAFIQEGRMTGTVWNDPYAQAQVAARLAAAMANEVPVETRYLVDYVQVTGENAAAIPALY